MKQLFLKTFFLIFKVYIKKINGLENYPKKGPYIIAGNHVSMMDPFFSLHMILIHSKKTRISAITNIKPKPSHNALDGFIVTMLDKMDKFFFEIVDRNIGDPIEEAVKKLKGGNGFIVYPEGEINPNKELLKGKTGIVKMAMKSGAPIIPIGYVGAEKLLPLNRHIPRLKRITINIGKPIYIKKEEVTYDVLDRNRRKIMKEISKLCGKPYNH